MKNHIHRIKEEALAIAVFIAVIWLVFALDMFLPLEEWGLIPRKSEGLVGIIAMTFLHGNFQHLMGNTVPLIVLLTLLAGSRADSRKIVLIIILLGGALLWLFGRSHSIHIGASLLVFGLVSFLILSGILEKRTIPMIISVVVALVYGASLLQGISPFQSQISWDGHLMGGVAGLFTAWLLVKRTKGAPV